MARFDDTFLSQLSDATEAESLIGQYVALKRRGRLLMGLCPFHNEKTPSFTVYPDTNSFYCFGCGAGGGVIQFLMRAENLDFIDAVKALAERAGLPMPEDTDKSSAYSDIKKRIYEANREAARFYYELLYLPKCKRMLDYFHGRGLNDKTITRFGLGAAPDEWRALYDHMREKGFSNELLVAADLVKRSDKNGKVSYYDTFRNRIIYPLVDIRGNVIAFSGRVLDDSKPKYVNSSETAVYKKGNELYALNYAKKGNSKKLILVEGYMDVISLHAAGFTDAIAGMGTALTPAQVNAISRYADTVYICYDSDSAGHEAVLKAITLCRSTPLNIKIVTISGKRLSTPETERDGTAGKPIKDADELIFHLGAEAFRKCLDAAQSVIEYKLSLEREKYDVGTSDGKSGYLKAAVKILAAVPDNIERDVYAMKLSEEFGITRDALINEVKRYTKRSSDSSLSSDIRKSDRERTKQYTALEQRKSYNSRAVRAEEVLLANLVRNPDFINKTDELSQELFFTETYKRFYSEIHRRLNDGRGIDITLLSEDFSPEEIAFVSKLYTPSVTISNTLTECNDCIAVLNEEHERERKKSIDPSRMSDDEFMKMFRPDSK